MAAKKTGNPLGRPKKKKNPIGRPKGEATVMKEYRQRMLNSPRSRKVLDTLFDVALDTEHKHWASATKIITDRILPVAGFEKEAGGTGRTSMQIIIKDAGTLAVSGSDGETSFEVKGSDSQDQAEAIEADFEVMGPAARTQEADYTEVRDATDSKVADVRPRVSLSDHTSHGGGSE